MLALRTSAPAFSAAEGERIARDDYGLAVAAAALPGERDCNLRLRCADGRQFVLKIIDEALDPGAAARQVAVLTHLAESCPDLPVPRLIPTQAGDVLVQIRRDAAVYSAVLTEFLSGEHLQSHAQPAQLRQIGATLALITRGLQGFFHASMQQRLAWDLRQLPQLMEYAAELQPAEARAAVEGVAQRLKDLLPRLRSFRSQAIHGDCHPRNLLFDLTGERVCGVLDFGDMIHAPLIFEPAIAMAELLMEGLATPATIGGILQAFAQSQRLEAAEVDALFDLIAARHAATLLISAWRSGHDNGGAVALGSSAEGALRSLAGLLQLGRESLTAQWHKAAGTLPLARGAGAVTLPRRHRLLGAGAELFYEKPLHIVRGEGLWLFDSDGQAYLDVYNNVPHVGHSHPAVVAAIAQQSAMLSTHTRYLHPAILDYAEELIDGLPPGLDSCIFVNSGSEANDVAWRLAKMASGHEGALIMDHAYHGITDAVGALTPGSGQPAAPWVRALAPPAEVAPAELQRQAEAGAENAVAALKQRGFAPAAWFIDSALTSSGIFDPPPEWGSAIERTVRAAGGLVVADEVQFGLGRAGSHFWSFERRGLRPDIITLGKPVGNGYPMGIVIAGRDLIETFQRKFGFFSTFGGNAVAATAGSAVLRVLREEKLQANALTTGEYLRARLADVASRHEQLLETRGCGLLQGLRVGGTDANAARINARRIVNRLATEHRILIGTEGPGANVLKMRPPMSFGPQHADQLAAAMEAVASA